MKLRQTFILGLIILLPFIMNAQVIDNTLSYKNINSDRYFRFNYENDFFAVKDMYYTQGLHVEIVSPAIRKFPLSKLLVHPKFNSIKYGIGGEHEGYTSSDIANPEIMYGDRPFAACWFLKTFLTATDTVGKQRFSSALSTGVIGPAALGNEMQTGIHKALNNLTPHGWVNQIHNDVILNYQVNYEHQLLSYGRVFSMDAFGMGRLGTLSDKISMGITLMGGYFDSPFGGTAAKKNNFRIYVYEHPEVSFIGYDATLQGGMFNKTSPYTINKGDISRITFQNRFGVVITYQRFYLEYFQSVVSKEFSEGVSHGWGGVQLAFGF